jgi:outer membrane protein assembly factor BamE
MRAVFAIFLLVSLSACEIVYKLPTRQGNVLEQKELDKVALGMTREQVKFILGTPIAASPLRDDRWDYFGYYKPPRGKAMSRTVSLYFQGDQLVRMEGEKQAQDVGANPDAKTAEEQKKQAETEDERAGEKKDGGIIKPPDQQDPNTPSPNEG